MSLYRMLELRRLLTIVLLYLQGFPVVMTNTFFVSHHGDDFNNCGDWNMSCRTVRHAVKMSNDGDQIYIDYAQGKPYMECENLSKSKYSIELRKSVSFYGINGKAEICCTKLHDLFNITSPSFNKTRVKFFNLIISYSNAAVRLDVGTRSELVFQNALVRNNVFGIYSRYTIDCSILITNSSFEHNSPGGTFLQCFNVTAQIMSSVFKLTPVLFANIGNKPPHLQNIRVWVRSTVVDGHNTQTCTDLFAIQPFAATLDVTITDSQFKNHVTNCKCKDNITTTLHIHGNLSNIFQIHSNIYLSNLLVENNHNNWATLALATSYQNGIEAEVMIRDSIFRNNSFALQVSPNYYGKYPVKSPTIFLENNTFVDNIYEQFKPNGAAAIYFSNGKSKVSACRFFNNKAGRNPYTGVVTIAELATVTFLNSYFENRQTEERTNQLFSLGNEWVNFSGYNTINLVHLKETQYVFVRIPTATSAAVIIAKNFKILCPQGYKLNPQRSCASSVKGIICYYINVRCEQCPPKTYTLARGELISNTSNNIQCQQCPRGGKCDSGLVRAKPSFWGYKSKMKVRFVQCPSGYCCETEDCVTYDSCHGNRSGTLCGQCSEGMSESLFSTQCILNTKCFLSYPFTLGMIALFVLYLLFFLYHKEILSFLRTTLFSKRIFFSSISRRTGQGNTDGNTFSSSGIIKIFFYYYQVCNLLRRSVGSSTRGEFLHNFGNAISRIMNMVVINLPSFNCPLKNLRPVPKIVVLHSVGYCLLVLLALLHLLNKLFLISRRLKRGSDRRTSLQCITARSDQSSSASKSSFSQRLLSAFTYISLLMYASSAQLCLSLLHCVPVGKEQVVFLDGNIKCYQTFQYFLLAYMISSILPFCLVPVLGSYLLKFDRIGVKQFCAACIFPLPFCCFWMYLLFRNSRCGNQGTIQQNNVQTDEQHNNDTESLGGDDITFACTDNNEVTSKGSESAILGVLLGPFRPHQAFACFPSSHIPWEGFLIFRRLVLIIVLTFVRDIQLTLFLALTLCVAILIFHMFVNPFQRKCDNILESFSLGAHVVLCCLTLLRALYYGEDYSFSKRLPLLNVIEKFLIVAPLSVIVIVVILCVVVKLAFGLRFCVSVCIRNVRRLVRFTV